MNSTACNFRAPGLCFVASDVNAFGHPIYERLRYAIWTARFIGNWDELGGEIYVLNVGLSEAQCRALRREDVRVVNVLHDGAADHRARRYPLDGKDGRAGQKFMYKLLCDQFVPADPLIVCDCDLEFRDPHVLEELLALARDRFFIVQERFRWRSNLNLQIELKNAGADKSALVLDEVLPIIAGRLPILNAGLFGGPRGLAQSGALHYGEYGLFDRVMSRSRIVAAALLDVLHWFWEQAALCVVCRWPELAGSVAELPTEYNWLTHWGMNKKAKILHFSGEELAEEFRTKIPESYLAVAGNRPEEPRRVAVATLQT